MNSTASIHEQDNEVTQSDIAAVEAALRALERPQFERNLLATIPQWFLVLSMFKRTEIDYTCLQDRSTVEAKYRAVLTSLMGLGEMIVAFSEVRDEDLAPMKYSRKMLECNVQYLRDKYDQWFGPQLSEESAEKIAKLFKDEPNSAA